METLVYLSHDDAGSDLVLEGGQIEAKISPLLRAVKPFLDFLVVALNAELQENSPLEDEKSEIPKEQAKMKEVISRGNPEIEQDSSVEEEKPEDDIRLKALFAKADKQIAENKSLLSSIKTLNIETLKLLNKRKA